jgi:hypothetical protein
MRHLSLSCICVLSTGAAAVAQQQVQINLAGLQIKNGVNQSKSSAPNTISPAFRYHSVVDGMVHGTGTLSILSILFPSPTPLAQVLETLAPGSSALLSGDFNNCPGTHPVNPPAQTIAGSQVVSGTTITYALTLGFQIDAAGVASFSITGVTLLPGPNGLGIGGVGGLVFDSGTATISRLYVCPPNCDSSTVAPVLNTGDFTCFLQQYSAGLTLLPDQQRIHYANCDCSTAEPAINTGDFTCFLQKFAAGCPAQ